MKHSWVIVAAFVLMIGTAGFSRSVLADDSETLRSPKGFVKSITDAELVVTQYDDDKNAEVDVAYLITPETQAEIYGDIPLGQVKVGDEVEIDYQNKNKKMIAEYVSVDLSSFE